MNKNKKKIKVINHKRFVTCLLVMLSIIIFTSIITVSAFNERKQVLNEEECLLVHVVNCGDTLWEISNKYRGKTEVREFVFYIKRENKLNTSNIYPGMKLRIPVEYAK